MLFNETTDAPNASVSLLVGMMVIKEAFGWSDSQLFEQCKFNLLVRSALGLYNLNDALPAESTYYLLRKRMYEHHSQTEQYQSPNNDEYCKDIDMVFTGIQGPPSRYDLEMTPAGLVATDTQTGERIQAALAKRQKNSKEERWRIKTDSGYKYFNQLAIRASEASLITKHGPTPGACG